MLEELAVCVSSYWFLMALTLYPIVGMMMLCMHIRLVNQSARMGFYLPDEHVRYVIVVFLMWPLIYWVYHWYERKLKKYKISSR